MLSVRSQISALSSYFFCFDKLFFCYTMPWHKNVDFNFLDLFYIWHLSGHNKCMYCYPRYMGPSIFQTFAIRVSGYHLKTGVLSSFDFIIFEWGGFQVLILDLQVLMRGFNLQALKGASVPTLFFNFFSNKVQKIKFKGVLALFFNGHQIHLHSVVMRLQRLWKMSYFGFVSYLDKRHIHISGVFYWNPLVLWESQYPMIMDSNEFPVLLK